VPTGTPTPLERQQMSVGAPGGETFWHTVRFELVGRLADDLGVDTVLDVGAGAGLLGTWLLTHRPVLRYRFEESSPVLDAALAERFGADRRSDPSEGIPASTLTVMLDVLEHIEDDVAALRTLARRMTPGAHLLATVPALQWAYSTWDEQLGHHRRYSRRSLRDVVTAARLEVVRADYLFPELLPLLPVRLLRRAPREHVDFPVLGPRATRIGHAVSSATARARRWWPVGTSVVVVARRPSA
jgi:hypothetical protein